MSKESFAATISPSSRHTSLDRNLQVAQVARLVKSGLDGVSTGLGGIEGDFDDMEGTTGVDFRDARQFQQNPPNLDHVVIPVHGGNLDGKCFHMNLPCVIGVAVSYQKSKPVQARSDLHRAVIPDRIPGRMNADLYDPIVQVSKPLKDAVYGMGW